MEPKGVASNLSWGKGTREAQRAEIQEGEEFLGEAASPSSPASGPGGAL